MKYLRHLFSLVFTLFFIAGLAFWLFLPAHAHPSVHRSSASPNRVAAPGGKFGEIGTASLSFPANPLLTPADGSTVNTFWPTFDWADATTDPSQAVVSYTLLITTSLGQTTSVTTTGSTYAPATALPNGVFTWTVEAYDDAGNSSGYVTPPASFTVTVTAVWSVYLPLIFKPEPSLCPTTSTAQFSLIPIDGAPADHPDTLHGDLNLSLRGYEPATGFLGLVNYSGSTDANAPQLAGLFEPNRFPGVAAVYQVYGWNWACGPHGCRGPLITNPSVTLAGLSTTKDEAIYIPERGPDIFSGGYKAMVLYAAEDRITLGYTRRDTVASGYSVHLENVCVDPNLLALYKAQTSADGLHITGKLPGLKNNEALGTALGSEMPVAIRDRGTFMDPRSRKDWWQGY